MKTKQFISATDSAAVQAAIAAAEAKTSGQIRIFVTRLKCPDAMVVARRHFEALGMAKTHDRNAVLIFIAPRSQTFAIVGDEGIHARCGDQFWNTLRDEMAGHLKKACYTDAILHGIEKAGCLLAEHFPPAKDRANEQPDDVIQDWQSLLEGWTIDITSLQRDEAFADPKFQRGQLFVAVTSHIFPGNLDRHAINFDICHIECISVTREKSQG